jgi:hypothetical protein
MVVARSLSNWLSALGRRAARRCGGGEDGDPADLLLRHVDWNAQGKRGGEEGAPIRHAQQLCCDLLARLQLRAPVHLHAAAAPRAPRSSAAHGGAPGGSRRPAAARCACAAPCKPVCCTAGRGPWRSTGPIGRWARSPSVLRWRIARAEALAAAHAFGESCLVARANGSCAQRPATEGRVRSRGPDRCAQRRERLRQLLHGCLVHGGGISAAAGLPSTRSLPTWRSALTGGSHRPPAALSNARVAWRRRAGLQRPEDARGEIASEALSDATTCRLKLFCRILLTSRLDHQGV